MISRRLALASATLALALFALPAARPAASDLHLALTKSAPLADEVVSPPREIRLWFTQEPQKGVTSLTLTDPAGNPAAAGKAAPDPADAKVFAAPVEGTLAPGRYTVSWRSMAADGHVARGEFAFTVQAQ